MADEEREPKVPPRGPATPPAPREEGRGKPQRLTQADLDRVSGGNQVLRNYKSPFDEP